MDEAEEEEEEEVKEREEIGNRKGKTFQLSAGVPQGSILSQTLYKVFILPLPQPLRSNNHGIIQETENEIETKNRFESECKI